MGTVPPIIASMKGLKVIDLSENMLHGSIPDLTTLQELKTLDLRQNNLEATLTSIGYVVGCP